MTVTVSQASSNNMADSLNSDIGTGHKLNLYDSGDTLLATMTYSAASGVVSTVSGAEVITYSEANYTDDETPGNAGTVSYATIATSGDTEVVRFSDPTNELGLSSTTIQTDQPVRVTTDVVIQMPDST
jgi:hypothetical protein